MTIGVFYFFLMEFLQYFQYLVGDACAPFSRVLITSRDQVIDDCSNWWNQVLTTLGFLHIW